MKLTEEEKQLKEAMKILLRDGKVGHLYISAKERFNNLYTDQRINNLGKEMESINLLPSYQKDVTKIKQMIS